MTVSDMFFQFVMATPYLTNLKNTTSLLLFAVIMFTIFHLNCIITVEVVPSKHMNVLRTFINVKRTLNTLSEHKQTFGERYVFAGIPPTRILHTNFFYHGNIFINFMLKILIYGELWGYASNSLIFIFILIFCEMRHEKLQNPTFS